MTKNLIETVLISNNDYKALLQERDELKQENKELKETVKQYCEWLDEERESNEKLQKVYQNDHCDLINYRSALEEIQKAIKSYDLTVDNGVSVDTLYIIRKIINEVLK